MAEIDSNYKYLTYEEMAKDVAEKALDEYIYKGKTLREWIDMLSSSEIPTRWIPVSERLPSDCGYDWVLAQIQESDTGYLWLPCVAEYRKGTDDWFSDANDIGWLRKHEGAFKVIAWMPLPKRYKASPTGGESEGEEK